MPSFDIVSKPNWTEVDNALNQAQKEIAQRFDFKDTGHDARENTGRDPRSPRPPRIARGPRSPCCRTSSSSARSRSASSTSGKIEPAPKGTREDAREGQRRDRRRDGAEIVKLIKDQKLKVQGSIHEAQVRVTGKNKDDLQACIQPVRRPGLRRRAPVHELP